MGAAGYPSEKRTSVRVVELSTNRKGAIAETAITAAAVRLGIDVYRPVSDGGRYDLILDTGERLLRTQCKWANREGDVVVVRSRTCRHTPRGYVFGTYCRAEVDGIAAWCPDTDDAYFVPIEEIDGRACIHLRLAPARNNQEQLVHWAAHYRLGAIAQLGERSAGSRKVGGSNPPSSTLEGPLP
jgi:PD-(D/E)XK nuclease superfamily protein